MFSLTHSVSQAVVTFVLCVAATASGAQTAPAKSGANSQVRPAKIVDNQPPESVRSARMMSLIREGKAQFARSHGVSFLKLHPGPPRTGEHCHILVAFAYADLLLDHRDEAGQALGVFDKGCRHTAVRDDYRAEVARVRRVLKGESMSVVYPR